MTRTDLKAITRKKLATMAREHQIPGWHGMRKAELIDILARLFRQNQSLSSSKKRRPPHRDRPNSSPTVAQRRKNGTSSDLRTTAVAHSGRSCRLTATHHSSNSDKSARKDRLIVDAQDSNWLHVKWELSSAILDRAEAAMGVEWRQAEPVLRVFGVSDDSDTVGSKRFVKDVEILQPIDSWYVPIDHPGQAYRLQLGYRAPSGNFFVIARSDKVKTPRNGSKSIARNNRGEGTRANGRPATTMTNSLPESAAGGTNNGNGTQQPVSKTLFHVDAEVVVYGQTHPMSQLSILGKPVQQEANGQFSIRVSLDEGRQVIPAICVTPNGCEQNTIILAIERNTKQLETLSLNEMD